MVNLEFYRNKRVFITGHNGFKGSWMCRVLMNAGANICGYSLPLDDGNNLFSLIGASDKIININEDIRNFETLNKCFESFQPEIVIHLAAQPLVRESYKNPRYTYETNVMGTVNLFECIRNSNSVKSVLNVTTDKVYKNNEWCWGYRENEPLDGFDPYSNSKSCSELVTHSYIDSFFKDRDISISTARAGNVIGGGDFAADRIIPDCIRAQINKQKIIVRNPYSIRPYQHVLEAIFAYLMIVEKQYNNKQLAGYYNVGPNENDCVNTGKLVELFCKSWKENYGWQVQSEFNAPHEANFLRLDCSKIKQKFGWLPAWYIEKAVLETCNWTKVWLNSGDISYEMDREILLYMKDLKERSNFEVE